MTRGEEDSRIFMDREEACEGAGKMAIRLPGALVSRESSLVVM